MSKRSRISAGIVAPIAVLALALVFPAQAQVPGSVQDYHLPPAPSPAATAAGPVDSDHPVAAPTATTPGPTATPSITIPPAPAATMPAVPPSRPPAPRIAPSQRATVQAEPALETPAPSSAPQPILPPSLQAGPAPGATAVPAPATVPSQQRDLPWPWIAGAAKLLLLLGGFWLWRQRTGAADMPDHEPESLSEPEFRPEPSPRPPAAAPRREDPPLHPAPLPADPRPIAMQLEARHLSRAMVNATLAYRLTLTNRSNQPTGPLRIAGDIVSAHASLSAEEQLAPGEAALETIHQVPVLAPGESVTLSGELRMPIAAILPINSGGTRVFVPLARFRAEEETSGSSTRVFVIGQASEQPGGALRPFALDRGPGVDRGLGQRELGIPA